MSGLDYIILAVWLLGIVGAITVVRIGNSAQTIDEPVHRDRQIKQALSKMEQEPETEEQFFARVAKEKKENSEKRWKQLTEFEDRLRAEVKGAATLYKLVNDTYRRQQKEEAELYIYKYGRNGYFTDFNKEIGERTKLPALWKAVQKRVEAHREQAPERQEELRTYMHEYNRLMHLPLNNKVTLPDGTVLRVPKLPQPPPSLADLNEQLRQTSKLLAANNKKRAAVSERLDREQYHVVHSGQSKRRQDESAPTGNHGQALRG